MLQVARSKVPVKRNRIRAFAIRMKSFVVLPSVVLYLSCGSLIVKARALIDNCAQAVLVADKFVRRNRLKVQKAEPSYFGVVGLGHRYILVVCRCCCVVQVRVI